MYVRDLEIKSRHYESECRRLGMLLQCYLAENHALRLSLHNNSQAFAASTTKQESAVLLLGEHCNSSSPFFSLLILPLLVCVFGFVYLSFNCSMAFLFLFLFLFLVFVSIFFLDLNCGKNHLKCWLAFKNPIDIKSCNISN